MLQNVITAAAFQNTAEGQHRIVGGNIRITSSQHMQGLTRSFVASNCGNEGTLAIRRV